MASKKQSPALAASGLRENDLAGKLVNREYNSLLIQPQYVAHLQIDFVSRVCGVPTATAGVLAELAFARCAP